VAGTCEQDNEPKGSLRELCLPSERLSASAEGFTSLSLLFLIEN
jgi:hypothetical protein